MHRTRLFAALVALSCLLLLPGCILGRVRDGVPIDPLRVSMIEPGRTTKSDVVTLLGAPTYVNDRVGLRLVERPPGIDDGQVGPLIDEMVRSPLDHSYTYEYSDTKSTSLFLLLVSFTNQETRRDRVVIFFDDRGVVSHLGVSLDADTVAFRLPTSDDEEPAEGEEADAAGEEDDAAGEEDAAEDE